MRACADLFVVFIRLALSKVLIMLNSNHRYGNYRSERCYKQMAKLRHYEVYS